VSLEYPDLSRYPYVVVDVETTGLRWWEDKVFSVALSTEGGSWYYDLRKDKHLEWARLSFPKVKTWVGHNLKFDLHFLREAGIFMRTDDVHDTMIRAALLNEHEYSYALDYLGTKYLNIGKMDIVPRLAEIFGGSATRNVQMKNLSKAPPALVEEYAIRDVYVTKGLYKHQSLPLDEQGLSRVYGVEMRLLPVLLDIERKGVRVDIEKTLDAKKELSARLPAIRRELGSVAGVKEFKWGSSKHLASLLGVKEDVTGWVTRSGESIPSTATGKPCFDKEALESLSDPLAAKVLTARSVEKIINTFLEGILNFNDDGIVHPTYNQTRGEKKAQSSAQAGTVSGRLSAMDPNIQQIPKRNKDTASLVRPLFLPDPGQKWVASDWHQCEFVLAANYMKDHDLDRIYADDPRTDFHQWTAELTGLPRNPVEGVKGNAKQVNLGLLYSMGQGTLAKQMGLPYETVTRDDGSVYLKAGPEAEDIFHQYHKAFPAIGHFRKAAVARAKSRGWIKTILGRRARFPKGLRAYKAVNSIVQGSAADIMKVKLIEIHNVLKGENARILLTVHDDISVSNGEGERVREKIKNVLQDFKNHPLVPLRLPLCVDMSEGNNWWEASQ